MKILQNLLIGLAASAIVAVLYGFFVAQREKEIRGYLATKREGWRRRRYVKALVGAVRGGGAASDTGMLGFLTLLAPLAIAVGFWYAADYLQSRLDYVDEKTARLTQELQQDAAAVTRESLETDLQQMRNEINQLRQRARLQLLLPRGISIMGLAGFYYGVLFWLPFAVLRRRFGHEIDRFTLRIQGLASKAELAELAIAESEVSDENSLRAFLDLAAAIAARHEVPQLADRFDLWTTNSK